VAEIRAGLAEVARYVDRTGDALGPLSRREALKHVPGRA
jgi:hypothetical protein